MTDRSFLRLVLIGAGLITFAAPARGDEADGKTKPTPGLLATQVTVTFDRIGERRERRQFRATVVGKGDDALTVLTAAHCLAPSDAGTHAVLKLGDEIVEAKILSVVRNPSYQGDHGSQTPTADRAELRRPDDPPTTARSFSRELPGPDNAVVRLRVFEPGNRPAADAFRAVRPAAGLAANPVPRPAGQTVSVRMIDGKGVEHALRAGNYANPRWLEWGPDYLPMPGDSGGGVFALVRAKDQSVRPVLIGVIVGQSGPGGGASLVSLQQAWLSKALPGG